VKSTRLRSIGTGLGKLVLVACGLADKSQPNAATSPPSPRTAAHRAAAGAGADHPDTLTTRNAVPRPGRGRHRRGCPSASGRGSADSGSSNGRAGTSGTGLRKPRSSGESQRSLLGLSFDSPVANIQAGRCCRGHRHRPRVTGGHHHGARRHGVWHPYASYLFRSRLVTRRVQLRAHILC
jgi:hypothetical protein